MSKRKQYSAKQKVKLVIEALSYPDGISAFCRKTGITDAMFYNWKDKLLSSADNVFNQKKKSTSTENHLKELLTRKDKIISALAEENIELKKNFGD